MTELNAHSSSMPLGGASSTANRIHELATSCTPMTDISRLFPAIIVIFLLWYFQ
jgi:hypothetical protein